MYEQALAFLNRIWDQPYDPPMWYEMRTGGTIFERHYFIQRYAAAEHAMEVDSRSTDVYYGVLPRMSMEGGSEITTPYTRWLWADVDTKGRTRLQAIDALNRIELLPTLLVDSGHGFHAYWRLKDPLYIHDASDVMKGMALELKSDQVHNPGRILRVPGTHNWKDKNGESEVRLLWDTGKEYRLSLFERFLPPLLPLAPRPKEGRLRPFEYSLDTTVPKGTRSERDFQVVCQMLEAGWKDAEIKAAFRQHPNGVGAKVAERGDKGGDKYLDLTIKKARQALDAVQL